MRNRAHKIAVKGRCDVYWGSHGCRKQRGHIGAHLCGNGCIEPDDRLSLYGEDALSPSPSVDRALREAAVGAPVSRPIPASA